MPRPCPARRRRRCRPKRRCRHRRSRLMCRSTRNRSRTSPTRSAPTLPRHVAPPNLANTPRIDQLMHDGKLYISMNDAVALALENNLDIAIARYNLNIADTDVWRAKAGASILGVNSGVVQNTPGGGVGGLGTQVGSGQGGTSVAAGGAGAGSGGLVVSTFGSGPHITSFDPILTGTLQIDHLGDQLQHPVLRRAPEHSNRQFHLHPGIPVGHEYGDRLQQHPANFR